ncbi:MAG TPA: FlgD immunoglobulin-like domain containing protein [Candidatus Krumholzibacteria bacterium]|nr:FlgD immunoglobulin-like domain containing protein [Candidatus Krumholzibacteria bacterium]
MVRILIATSLLVLAATAHSAPREPSRIHRPNDDRIVATGHARAKLDTVFLLGGPDRQDGKFQDDANPSLPDAEGWIGVDLTTSQFSHWQDSAFHSPTGTQAAWCGILLQPCSPGDPPQGYANNWKENLVWSGAVADPGLPTDVTVNLSASWDTESGFDFLRLQVWRHGAQVWETFASWTGAGTEIGAVHVFTAAPEDLDAGRVRWRLRGESDGAWSDGDCSWPTAAGLCQVDDVSVTGTNGLPATFDDFADGIDASAFTREYDQGVGNFAQVWPGLVTLDPCDRNRSPRFAFIDDGVVVPCTGGTPGQTWTYGPGGFGVNLTGGCLEPDDHLHNEIWSPPIAWADAQGQPLPAAYAAAILEFDVYRHLPTDNGLVQYWLVRSSRDGGESWGDWASDWFVHSSDAARVIRESARLDTSIDPERTTVQIALGVQDLGWIWGFDGTDPTPAPSFDNVALKAFPVAGPRLEASQSGLAQDAFPAGGTLDFVDLGSNDVPVDIAQSLTPYGSPVVTPGDSIVVKVTLLGEGAQLVGTPELHYVLHPNPLFDPYRLHPLTGFVTGTVVHSFSGSPSWIYAFDLPDEDFFYPGDVIHYFITAEQDGPFAGVTTLPASLDGFGVFAGEPGWTPGLWSDLFTVRALPSLFSAAPGDQPRILFWRDDGAADAPMEWLHALFQTGADPVTHADLYTTRSPLIDHRNGLGGRATPEQLAGYDLILYEAGYRDALTLTPDDQALLTAWIGGGGSLALFGDHIAADLAGGAEGQTFLADVVGAGLAGTDVAALIAGPSTPAIVPEDPVQGDYDETFFAYGACPDLRTFDAVAPLGSARRLFQWEAPGTHPYAAGLKNATEGGTVYLFPCGFTALWSQDPQGGLDVPGAAMRTSLLSKLLLDEGFLFQDGWDVDVRDAPVFTTDAAPNPFNPEVVLSFTAPRDVRAVVEIYDVRGAKVRTLLDARVDAGPHTATWDGRDDGGTARASGVYFARVKVGEETRVEKLALIR